MTSNPSPIRPKRCYSSTTMSVDVRNFIGSLLDSLERTSLSMSQFSLLLKEAGHEIPMPTLYFWRQQFRNGGSVIKRVKKSGSSPKLTDDETQILCGLCLFKNLHKELVSLSTLMEFSSKFFNTTISKSTASRLFVTFHMSSKKVQKRTAGYQLSFKEGARLYYDYIVDTLAPHIADKHLNQIGSFDFTFTRHSHTDLHSFAPIGRFVEHFLIC